MKTVEPGGQRRTSVSPALVETANGDHERYGRILDAASALLVERGYAGTSTLEIASRARLSKRELYTLFENKQAILTACVARRTEQLRLPLAVSPPHDRATLAGALTRFGGTVLRELSDPLVVAMYRLASAEPDGSHVLARTLDTSGRSIIRTALMAVLAQAQTAGLLGGGEPSRMAAEFFGLLWGDLQLRLVLGVADRPMPQEMDRRARSATDALLRLHPIDEPAAPPRTLRPTRTQKGHAQ